MNRFSGKLNSAWGNNFFCVVQHYDVCIQEYLVFGDMKPRDTS